MGIGRLLGLVLAATLLWAVPAPAQAAIEVEGSQVVFTWPPASGPVEGYYVYLSVNDAPEEVDHATPSAQSIPIPGIPGDRIRVRVAAFDAADNVGPLSPPSDPRRGEGDPRRAAAGAAARQAAR